MTAAGALVRVKTSDQVADRILGLLFSGRLRAGDRIDLDALAAELGVSRVPIREALAQLERDGIASIPHHRGAFVSAFDAATVREAFELYALLSGLSTARVTRSGDKEVIGALARLEADIAKTDDLDRFEELARDFRRVINLAAGGPHLRALLRTFRGLVPATARFGMPEAMLKEKEYIGAELEAIRRGSVATAARMAIEHVRYSGQCAVNGLARAGIFPPGDLAPQPPQVAELVQLINSLGV